MNTTFQIGQKVKNTVNGKTETVKEISGNYVNGYRSDLWVLAAENENGINNIPEDLLTKIFMGFARWNKKFYGNNIYVNNVKYSLSFKQIEELSRFFQVEY